MWALSNRFASHKIDATQLIAATDKNHNSSSTPNSTHSTHSRLLLSWHSFAVLALYFKLQQRRKKNTINTNNSCRKFEMVILCANLIVELTLFFFVQVLLLLLKTDDNISTVVYELLCTCPF